MLTVLVIYLVFGCFAGLLAGLLGVGGGLIIVPIVVYGLSFQGVTAHVQHLAVGTSLASIIFTSMSSVWAHNRRGSVGWRTVWRFSPGIVVGTSLGGVIAAQMATKPLAVLFVIFLCGISVQMLLDIKPKPSRHLPGTAGLMGVGGVIGFASSFVGIGGGSLIVPFLSMCNVAMRTAIGTSAAIGFFIALSGAVNYIIHGWNTSGLPPHSFGYVYLPALAGIVTASMLAAPYGAKLAYKLPVTRLKKIFAYFILFVALNMIYKFFVS